jgi:hypothetical protein
MSATVDGPFRSKSDEDGQVPALDKDDRQDQQGLVMSRDGRDQMKGAVTAIALTAVLAYNRNQFRLQRAIGGP